MFLLLLTSSASTCLQHSPNHVPTIISPSVNVARKLLISDIVTISKLIVKLFPSFKLSNAAARMGGEGGILEEDEETAAGADRTR